MGGKPPCKEILFFRLADSWAIRPSEFRSDKTLVERFLILLSSFCLNGADMTVADLHHDPAHAEMLDLLAVFSRFGATPEGGVSRLACDPQERKARACFTNWLTRNGFKVRIDQIGNIFGIVDFADIPQVACRSSSRVLDQARKSSFFRPLSRASLRRQL